MNSNDITLTADQLDELVYHNNNFKGKVIRLEKRKQYMDLFRTLEALSKISAFVKSVVGSGIKPGEQNSKIYVDLGDAAYLTGEEGELYKRAVSMADDIVMAITPSGNMRISFSVNSVWSD